MEIINVTTLGSEILKRITDEDIYDFVNKVVKPDPVLRKLHQFTFNPPIEDDFSAYPINQKSKQLDEITEEDWDYFFDKFYLSSGSEKDCFRFFRFRLQVANGILKYFKKFPEYKIPLELVFDHVSWNTLTEFTDDAGRRKIDISMGKYWPILWLTFLIIPDQSLFECHVHWLLRSPDKELENEENQWDKETLRLYQIVNDDCAEILTGYNLQEGKDPGLRFRLYYWCEGSKLKLSKRSFFEFPITHRYEPLIREKATYLKKQYELLDSGIRYDEAKEKGEIYHKNLTNEAIWQVKKEMLGLAKGYKDVPEYPNPPGYFKSMVQYIGSEFYEKQSSEAGNRPCDPDCKKQRDYEDQLPCPYEDSLGFCTDPTKKRKLMFRLEQSGGIIKELDKNHDEEGEKGEAFNRMISPAAEEVDPHEGIDRKESLHRIEKIIESFDPIEKKIYKKYWFEEKKQGELAQQYNMTQGAISKLIRKLNERIRKKLNSVH